MQNDILFFAEQRNGHLNNISREIAGGAKRLATKQGGRAVAFLPGFDVLKNAESLFAAGADFIFYADSPDLLHYSASRYAALMKTVVKELNPSLILLGSTAVGQELAPILAASFDIGLVSDCTGIWLDETALKASDNISSCYRMERPCLDGIHVETLCSAADLPAVMATLRPGVMRPLAEMSVQPEFSSQAEMPVQPEFSSQAVKKIPLSSIDTKDPVTLVEIKNNPTKTDDITKARVLAAGGRGMGGKKGFENLKRIASLLGGSIACSRACVESGWVDAVYQVGQTGRTVHPDLYLACGISGAIQHTTGMNQSKLIIAVNKNPAAPIFSISDLGIIGNQEVILPALIRRLENYKK